MACHTRAGVRCYLDFLPKKITQQQWHTLRNKVMEEIGAERLSRSRVDSTEAIQTGQDLMDALEADGYTQSEQDRRHIVALTRNASVTEGTVQVIKYLSANGPVSTLDAMSTENEVHSEDGVVEYDSDLIEPFNEEVEETPLASKAKKKSKNNPGYITSTAMSDEKVREVQGLRSSSAASKHKNKSKYDRKSDKDSFNKKGYDY